MAPRFEESGPSLFKENAGGGVFSSSTFRGFSVVSFEAQPDPSLLGVHPQNLDPHCVSGFHHVFGFFHPFLAQLGDMDQTVDPSSRRTKAPKEVRRTTSPSTISPLLYLSATVAQGWGASCLMLREIFFRSQDQS